jgi:hypothetical protein
VIKGLVQARGVAQRLLCPEWRWMSLLLGTWCMFYLSRLAAPSSGRLLWWQGPITVAFGVVAFLLFWAASRPTKPTWLSTIWQRLPAILRWRGWRACIIMLLALNSWFNLTSHINDLFDGHYHTDALSFVHIDADLVLQGKNPYSDNNAFWLAELRWPESLATPMMNGVHLGNDPLNYPTNSRLLNLLRYEALNPAARTNDFDPATVHNYPAGIIWLVLPLIWAGVPSMLWVNLLAYAAMIWLILMQAQRRDRAALLTLFIFSPVIIDFMLFDNIDTESIVFVLAAWIWMAKPRTSAILFGIACAVKQLAWFVAPFYLLEVVRREGWLAALKRAAWMAGAFAVVNLPYIITSPQAWFHSIMVPMSDPMFPLGYGMITLAQSGLVPLMSDHVWTLIVLAVMGGLLLFQWKRKEITSDGIFLGLIPLWFSWRSPMNYLVLIPVLAAWVAVQHIAKAEAQRKAAQADEIATLATACDVPESVTAPEPELVGAR